MEETLINLAQVILAPIGIIAAVAAIAMAIFALAKGRFKDMLKQVGAALLASVLAFSGLGLVLALGNTVQDEATSGVNESGLATTLDTSTGLNNLKQ